MKKGVIMLFFILLPLNAYGDQWKFFEHRYPYKLEDVLQADRFVQKKGYWEGYRGRTLLGYVFISKDWTEKLVGYSGKHMETLIGIDINGNITGVKLLFHSEPIVLIGLKEENYQKFLKQYQGKSILKPLSVGKEISMDAITGATVTAVVQNVIILGSARKVASETGLIKVAKKAERRISQKYQSLTWEDLQKAGGVKNLKVYPKELGIKGAEAYIDLYFGILNPPSIGRNVLGEALYRDIMSSLKNGETAIFVVATGTGSFKGSGFARGGVFDRFNLEQESKVYVFRDRDYRILTELKSPGAPVIKEGGIFIVRDMDFDPTGPFTFNLLLPYRPTVAKKEFKSFTTDYRLPERFME
ncbi:MAG: FMN-binding protein [Thermodesulfovibrionales bacterium]